MAKPADGRKTAKAITSVVAMGALATAGLGSAALYGTITAAASTKAAAMQSSSTTTPDTSGSSPGSGSGSDSGSQSGAQSSSGTQLLPGYGSSHSRSSGS